MLTLDTIRSAPKALLHDHLDGGLRPATIVDLAREYGYRGLPTRTSDELAAWIRRGADRKSLELYLETFAHTCGVMQHPDAIARVAAECAEDLAADGVVYAEVRFAPELSTERGLTLDEVVDAILEGFRIGHGERGRGPATRSSSGPCVTAMRQAAHSHGDRRARGPPPRRRRRRLRHRRPRGRLPADAAPRRVRVRPPRELPHHDPRGRVVRAAVASGRRSRSAARSGSATASGSSTTSRSTTTARSHLGRLAAFVRDPRVPLELCPTSNVHTGGAASIAEHPIDLLRRLRFRVTVNTDNRLMSGVSLSSEFKALDEAFGIGLGEMEWLTINALKSSFIPFDERLYLINEVVKPGYARLRREGF